MKIDQDTIRALAGLANELDDAIKAIDQTLVKLDLNPLQREAAEAMRARLWDGSSKAWELLYDFDRRVPPFGRHLPDDWPLAG